MGTERDQNERYRKYRERYLDKARETAARCFQRVEELPGSPEALAYFTKILRTVFLDNEAVRYGDHETFIGTFCETMPSEIISAAGARPVRLCSGSYAGFHIGDYATPRDVCPLVKAAAGNVMGGISEVHSICEMYIVPIACDCKKKLAGSLSDIKPVVPLYLPLNRTDDDGMDTFVKELKKTAGRISELTGAAVTRESLIRQIRIRADVQKEILTFLKLRNEEGILIRGTHALIVMNAMAYDDVSEWGRHLRKLNEELAGKKERKEYLTKKKLPRILLAGSPVSFPALKIPLLIEEQGGILAADETCPGDREAVDVVSVCEDTLDGCFRALANRCVRPCPCPVFPDNGLRIRRLDKAVEEGHIDGIIYHVLRGCLVHDYEYEQIEQHFRAKNIPVMRLESDFSEEDTEQLRIRIEAFIEMIRFRNREEGTHV